MVPQAAVSGPVDEASVASGGGRPPRLLQIIPTPGRGGCEEYALSVARESLRRGWSLAAALPPGESTRSLIADYEAVGASVDTVDLLPPASNPHHALVFLPRLWRTRRLIHRIEPTIVQIVLPWPVYGLGPILAAALARVPTQVVFQLVTDSCQPLSRLTGRLYRRAKVTGQRWVAVSDQNRRLISAIFGVPSCSLDLIYNGVDNKPCTASRAVTRTDLFAALGWPMDTTLIMSTGRLHTQKGFDLLARIAPAVLRSHPRVRFALAGEGPQRGQLEQLLQRYGIRQEFALLGHRSDVPALLGAADLFVFPSRYEGHPFALVEAMSAGLPVIASDASGIPEAVTDRRSGVLFRAEDPCDLLDALRRTLDQERNWRTLGGEAMQAAARFGGKRMLDETFSMFSEMATGAPDSTRSPRRTTAARA